jgi:hypothetical protein
MDPLLSVDEARAKKEKLMKELADAQQQEEEAKQREALLLAQNIDAQGLQAAIARADVAEQLAQTQQARILELTARNTVLEQEIVRIQTANTAHLNAQSTILTDHQTLGSTVTAMAGQLAAGLGALEQVVQTATRTIGEMREQHTLLQPVLARFTTAAPASTAAPLRSEVLGGTPNLSLARTAGTSHLRNCCSCSHPHICSIAALAHTLTLVQFIHSIAVVTRTLTLVPLLLLLTPSHLFHCCSC